MADGGVFSGQFRSGKYLGGGEATLADGVIGVCGANSNCFDGLGEFTAENGQLFSGSFRNGMLNGNGEQIDGKNCLAPS